MKLCIFGASGKTGKLLVERALEEGHEVTVAARSPEKMAALKSHVQLVSGDLNDLASISKAIEGQDAVLSTLGTVDRKPNTILSDGTANIIKAMQGTDCKRLIVITSLGCRDSLNRTRPFLFRELVVKRLAREIWADKERQEEVIEKSGLDYTILRPGGLSEGFATGDYQILEQTADIPKTWSLARGDLAEHMLKILNEASSHQKIYTILGSPK